MMVGDTIKLMFANGPVEAIITERHGDGTVTARTPKPLLCRGGLMESFRVQAEVVYVPVED